MSTPAGLLQVDRDRTLAAVAHEVQRAHPVDPHADPACDVADARPLDLDHLGALVGEQRGRVRTGERDRAVEDADAVVGARSLRELRVQCAAARAGRCTRGPTGRHREVGHAHGRARRACHASMSASSAA